MSAFSKKWSSNARQAMAKQPDYFVWWYTAKSIALVGAIATAAYFAGKARGVRIGRRSDGAA